MPNSYGRYQMNPKYDVLATCSDWFSELLQWLDFRPNSSLHMSLPWHHTSETASDDVNSLLILVNRCADNQMLDIHIQTWQCLLWQLTLDIGHGVCMLDWVSAVSDGETFWSPVSKSFLVCCQLSQRVVSYVGLRRNSQPFNALKNSSS